MFFFFILRPTYVTLCVYVSIKINKLAYKNALGKHDILQEKICHVEEFWAVDTRIYCHKVVKKIFILDFD